MSLFPDPASPLVAVSSEIGRGHPSYLDSILTAIGRIAPAPVVPVAGARDLSSDISRSAWSLAETGYRLGGSGGPFTWLYNRVRSGSRPSRLALNLLGGALRERFHGYRGTCLVDHPLLGHILSGTCRVAYVHGEIAAPAFSAVPGAWRTFVPLESTAARLAALGVDREALAVTGLIIEPELVDRAEASFAARLRRLSPAPDPQPLTPGPLTVGFFLSGARPRPHINRIIAAAISLAATGNRAVLFWGQGMVGAMRTTMGLERNGVSPDLVRVVWSRSRRDETSRTAAMLGELDVLVAASHERTNWAVGLGLPMFALMPAIGPFASENLAFAVKQGVCLPLATLRDARNFGATLTALLRSGRLAEMSRNGWGRLPITGAEAAARTLLAAVR